MVAVPVVLLTKNEFQVYYNGEHIGNHTRTDSESASFVYHQTDDGTFEEWKLSGLGKDRICIIKEQGGIFKNRHWYFILNKNTDQMETRTELQSIGDDFVALWETICSVLLCIWKCLLLVPINLLFLIPIVFLVFVPIFWKNETNVMYPGDALYFGNKWIINDEYYLGIENCQVWLTRVLIGNLTASHNMTPHNSKCDNPFLLFQSDGNLVLYDSRGNNDPVWASGTNGKGYKKVKVNLIKGEFIFF